MVVAGVVTLLFRQLRQPPILGYLIAGLLVSPYTFPVSPVQDVGTVRALADLGLILLLFSLGLEFSWSKIRQIGPAVLIIGVVEITTMIGLGYGLGRLLGWSTLDAVFLGAAMHISSTAVIMRILADLGRKNLLSSRLIMGILVVEDFAAVVIIAVLSGVATTGVTDLGNAGWLVLKLAIFVIAVLGIGALIVPRVMSFTRRFHSNETLLITALALCFGLSMFSKYLGLSAAAGAFLMGALIGDTEHSEEVIEVVSPVRDMFAALFFVTIGMLINIVHLRDFIIPAICVAVVFMLGKIAVNTMATFATGYGGRTAMQVGMGKAQMGEFSLAIAKIGVDHSVVVAPLYPVIATATALTSLAAPYIIRSADSVVDFLDRRAPRMLREYVTDITDWLQALRRTSSRQSDTGHRTRRMIRAILIDLAIIAATVGTGTVVLQFTEELAGAIGMPQGLLAAVLGFLVIVLCVPAVVLIWRNLRSLVDEAVRHALSRRASARLWGREGLRIVLRDSIFIILAVLVGLWFVPFVSRLLFFGSLALTVPLLLLALVLYIVLTSVTQIHSQFTRTFGRMLLGEEQVSAQEAPTLPEGVRGQVAGVFRGMKSSMARFGRLRLGRRVKTGESDQESDAGDKEPLNNR